MNVEASKHALALRIASPASNLISLSDIAWVVFIFGAAGGLRIAPIENPERYFWAPLDAIVVYFLIRQSRLFVGVLNKNRLLTLWAILGISSALWSVAPALSLYLGLQLLMTVLAGALLCLCAELEKIIKLLFVGLFLTAFASLVVCMAGLPRAISVNGEWLGVYPHKNMLGLYMTLLVTTSLCLCAARWRPVITSLGFFLGAALIALSRSGTALLSLVFCLSVFGFAAAARHGNRAFATIAGFSVAGAAIFAFITASGEFDVGAKILAALGKDTTLTGRTTIWDFGLEQFWREPFLGVGYRAYWESSLTSSKMLQAVMKQNLPHFHNNFLDVAVGLGIIGLILFVAGVFSVNVAAIQRYMNRPDFINLWPVLFLAHALVSCTVEAPIYLNHSLFQSLLVVAASARRRANIFIVPAPRGAH